MTLQLEDFDGAFHCRVLKFPHKSEDTELKETQEKWENSLEIGNIRICEECDHIYNHNTLDMISIKDTRDTQAIFCFDENFKLKDITVPTPYTTSCFQNTKNLSKGDYRLIIQWLKDKVEKGIVLVHLEGGEDNTYMFHSVNSDEFVKAFSIYE